MKDEGKEDNDHTTEHKDSKIGSCDKDEKEQIEKFVP